MLDRILDIGVGYFKSQVLFASYKIGIFELLPATLPDLKMKLRVDHADQIKLLLNCLQKLNLLTKKGDSYFCLFDWRKYEKYIKHLANLQPLFVNLHDNIMLGKPSIKKHHDIDIGTLLQGLEDISIKEFPISIHGNVLDVGAGTGFYSKLAAEISEVKNIWAIEKPDIFKILVEKTKDYSSIINCSGYYLSFKFNIKFDFIILSQVLHGRRPADRELFAKKLVDDLAPNGKILIREQLDDNLFGALFGMNMLVCTGSGCALSYENIEKLFGGCKVRYLCNENGWIDWVEVTKC